MADYLGAAKWAEQEAAKAAHCAGYRPIGSAAWQYALDQHFGFLALAGLLYLVALARDKTCWTCGDTGKALDDGMPVYCQCEAGERLWQEDCRRYDRRGTVLP